MLSRRGFLGAALGALAAAALPKLRDPVPIFKGVPIVRNRPYAITWDADTEGVLFRNGSTWSPQQETCRA